MGKHSEWRKLAKKAQRQRKRRIAAILRSELESEEQLQREKSPSYQNFLQEQQQLEEFQAAEELRISKEQEALYQKREKEAQEKWRMLQQKLQIAQAARTAQNIKIREEWEAEQKRLQALKEEKARQEELRILQEQKLQQKIDEFINNNGEMPDELNQCLETNPGKIVCPFFTRTGACRFGDMCSRNHIRPTISNILLFKNFYSHYSLDTKENEHGDASLEFENQEIYKHFQAFFNDVVPELENFGTISQFKVCCNKEQHLRGNVYVGYSSCREAMRSYRRFHGRFYAGKQLNVEFCTIESWKSAICGLFFGKRCPKGSVCNFLHVFRNPGNLYSKMDVQHSQRTEKVDKHDDWNSSERSNWRWSSSPEVIKKDIDKNRHKFHKRKRSRSRSKVKTREKSRSKSRRHRSTSRKSSSSRSSSRRR
ncbi:U2 small nuclear ribonucleoprotein auxiliary factor 35 kDa subunit-related protein 2 [Atheta coriaria]|uniref:U2 small nuclear ribonucleoprotein auxiliary factor 35 kDa subunit-related protein 2 n=1 Tax=Dalotia coriaria TaxID=877792 RepID=UPI0031F45D47